MKTYVVKLISRKSISVTIDAENLNDAAKIIANKMRKDWTVSGIEAADHSEVATFKATCAKCSRIIWQADCPGVDYFRTLDVYICLACAKYHAGD